MAPDLQILATLSVLALVAGVVGLEWFLGRLKVARRNRAGRVFEAQLASGNLFEPGDRVEEKDGPKIVALSYRENHVLKPRQGEVLGQSNPFGPSFQVQWDGGRVEEVHGAKLRRILRPL